MNSLLIDGLIQHIFSFNNYIDYSRLASVSKIFNVIINDMSGYSTFSKKMIDMNIPFNKKQKLFDTSCRYGHLDIAKWLYSSNYEKIKTYFNVCETFSLCCKHGNLDVSKWLYSICKKYISKKKMRDIFMDNFYINDLDFSEWLYSIDTNIVDDHLIEELFHDTCRFYDDTAMNKVVWLYSLNNNINIHDNDDRDFVESCSLGNTNIVEWLYSIGQDKINIHAHYNDAFIRSCQNGHINIARWLYSIGQKDINRHDINTAFSYSCFDGRLEVAQWLYSINAEIDDYIFKNTCQKGHFEIVKWLYSTGKVSKNSVLKTLGNIDIVYYLLSIVNSIPIIKNE